MVVQQVEIHLTMLIQVVAVELRLQENLLQVLFQVVDPVVMVVQVQQLQFQEVQQVMLEAAVDLQIIE
tara:strand:+ start:297 stop:500 length:204 start_codon:yes stop_codon:yes gene_type:complete